MIMRGSAPCNTSLSVLHNDDDDDDGVDDHNYYDDNDNDNIADYNNNNDGYDYISGITSSVSASPRPSAE